MNILKEIVARIPDRPNLTQLISGATIQREIEVEGEKSHATLVITTKRKMTLDGGNGWDGIDGADVEIIRRAVRDALVDNEAPGIINNIVIREEGY